MPHLLGNALADLDIARMQVDIEGDQWKANPGHGRTGPGVEYSRAVIGLPFWLL